MENEIKNEQKRKPYKSVRVGNIVLSLWRSTTKDGREFTNVTIQKNYKKEDGTWANTNSFGKNDLSSISFGCLKAFNELE